MQMTDLDGDRIVCRMLPPSPCHGRRLGRSLSLAVRAPLEPPLVAGEAWGGPGAVATALAFLAMLAMSAVAFAVMTTLIDRRSRARARAGAGARVHTWPQL
jgi:hypothetical protein